MKTICIDGLGGNRRMAILADKLNASYYPWTAKNIPINISDFVVGYSLGGRTAIEQTGSIIISKLVLIDPVFGLLSWSRTIPDNVLKYMHLKASWTLPWAIPTHVKRVGPAHDGDCFHKVSSNHLNIPEKAEKLILDFLGS